MRLFAAGMKLGTTGKRCLSRSKSSSPGDRDRPGLRLGPGEEVLCSWPPICTARKSPRGWAGGMRLGPRESPTAEAEKGRWGSAAKPPPPPPDPEPSPDALTPPAPTLASSIAAVV